MTPTKLFEEDIYQDIDFKLLYQPDMDGIDHSPEFSHLGMGLLRFDEWLIPFDNDRCARLLRNLNVSRPIVGDSGQIGSLQTLSRSDIFLIRACTMR